MCHPEDVVLVSAEKRDRGGIAARGVDLTANDAGQIQCLGVDEPEIGLERRRGC